MRGIRNKFITAALALILAAVSVGSPVSVTASELENGLDSWQINDSATLDLIQEETISPVTMATMQDLANAPTSTTLNFGEGEEDEQRIYPVYIPERGAVTFAVGQQDLIEFNSLQLDLCQDATCTDSLGSLYAWETDTTDAIRDIFCPAAGTYYLKVTFDRKSNVTSGKNFLLRSWFVSNADRALPENTLAYTYADYDAKDTLYKVNVKESGMIAFSVCPTTLTGLMTGTVTLYNSKKNAISAQEYISNSADTNADIKYARAFFSVKKGTYYIQFSASQPYFAGYSLKKATNSAGATKAKAATLKFGKTKKGLIVHTDSAKKAGWYKIKLNKKQNFKLVVTAYTSGNLNMQIIPAKKVIVTNASHTFGTKKFTYKTTGKWDKGTYYIKFTKTEKKSSGYYTIKLKK